MLETRGTLLVPCMLEVMIPLLEVVVEIGVATGEDECGEDEAAGDVEDPATGAVAELAGTTEAELATPALEELARTTAEELAGVSAEETGRITADELGSTSAEELGTMPAEELGGAIKTLLVVEVEAGAVGVIVVVVGSRS